MGSNQTKKDAPDIEAGIPLRELPESRPFLVTAAGEPVVLVRKGEDVRALAATCTHYGGPLDEGLVVGDTIRCPWHHACFSLFSGEALAAPALNPVATFGVTVRDGRVFLGDREERPPLAGRARVSGPESVVIVGAGAAGSAAAEMLRREGFDGPISLIDPDTSAPYDRPNLSKDYLAGTAPEEWLPLRPSDFYAENGIDRVAATAESIDPVAQTVRLGDGRELRFGALLLATGSTPVRLSIAGADLPHVHVLRSLADCRAILSGIGQAKSVVVLGASFIGMEVAASLRSRGLEVTVVAPDAIPFERTLGRDLGRLLQDTHEGHAVRFRLGRTAAHIGTDHVILNDGTFLSADLVVVGIGVRPDTRLAEAAGLATQDGVLVDERLQTSVPNVFAAGDIARYPDPRSGERIRVEHWVAAQRQGQAAARNILGHNEPFTDPPFFWTQQWDVGIAHVGHAAEWDDVQVDGDIEGRDAAVRYLRDGRVLALSTIGRDCQSLETEAEWEAAVGAGRSR